MLPDTWKDTVISYKPCMCHSRPELAVRNVGIDIGTAYRLGCKPYADSQEMQFNAIVWKTRDVTNGNTCV